MWGLASEVVVGIVGMNVVMGVVEGMGGTRREGKGDGGKVRGGTVGTR